VAQLNRSAYSPHPPASHARSPSQTTAVPPRPARDSIPSIPDEPTSPLPTGFRVAQAPISPLYIPSDRGSPTAQCDSPYHGMSIVIPRTTSPVSMDTHISDLTSILMSDEDPDEDNAEIVAVPQCSYLMSFFYPCDLIVNPSSNTSTNPNESGQAR
jgi:hypothetical protein